MMPSNANYVRDYKQERVTSKSRGETGVGSKSSDARRHRARRAYMKRNGALSPDPHVDHKNPLRSGGSDSASNLQERSASSKTSHGGGVTHGQNLGAGFGDPGQRFRKRSFQSARHRAEPSSRSFLRNPP